MPSFPEVRSPLAAVDVIIETKPNHIVLVKRNHPPFGWALPGGFVDYGEGLWETALREAYEETSLNVRLIDQLYTYSDPGRDERCHTVTTVFLASVDRHNLPHSLVSEAKEFDCSSLPPLAFDHGDIVNDYLEWRQNGVRPGAVRRRSFAEQAASQNPLLKSA